MKKLFFLPIFIFTLILLSAIFLPVEAAPPVGNYLVLNGGYVKTYSSNSFSPTLFVFDAWIKLANMSSYPNQVILSIGNKNTNKLHYEISSTINRQINLTYYHGSGGYTSLGAGQLLEDQWNHLRIEINSSSAKLFINDSLIYSPTLSNYTLRPIGPDIVLGTTYNQLPSSVYPSGGYHFYGNIDEVSISDGNYLLWHLDETRGATIADDATANNLDGTLIGGDSLIHFFGVLPTSTPTPTQAPFGLPPIRWTRPVLPTLSFPFPVNPSPTSVQPPSENPTPTTSSIRDFSRPTRSFTR